MKIDNWPPPNLNLEQAAEQRNAAARRSSNALAGDVLEIDKASKLDARLGAEPDDAED